MEQEQLGRRNMLARTSLALGGLVTLGSLQGCGSDSSTSSTTPTPITPTVADFPYDKHIAANYQLDPALVQEAAYHAYYSGGCCHGSFSALISHLSATVGAPFNLLPIGFGKFGAGGIDSYGSICGSLLGAELVINMIASDTTARKNMIWELMRWYETYAFPVYVPATVDPAESTTLSFTGGTPTMTPVAPGAHLCHASVSKWCLANAVSAGSGDKKARCARLTADVAGKAVALINAYLAASPRAYGTIGVADPNAKCDGCHTAASAVNPSVASDMTCVTCHPIAGLPAAHPTVTP
jgi:hypothetical protein